ncbi:MAG TPA: carboxylesterase family protein [Mycobacteriales bacterium]|nr:carboxylesterase family protein [Mycobacteriales bacterium]
MTEPIVETDSGALRGSRAGDVATFAGVPFAQPPVGELRFAPPQPVDAWPGIKEATEFAPDAPHGGARRQSDEPQPTPSGALAGFAALAGGGRPWSEDCLYLNVWAPVGADRAPVIVWLYGGGFEGGSASPPISNGAALAKATGCVVVAPTYRVGALGFAHLADLGGAEWSGSTNLGLQDQVAALRWCRRNVAAFGGNPANVTVAGVSAGAFCIGAMLATPSASGLFKRAILSSGSTQRIFPAATATRIAQGLLEALRVDDLDDLRQVEAQQILDVQLSVIDSDIGLRNLPGGRSWGVVLDGTVLPEHPHDALARGAARDVALLVSANRDEMRLFQATQPDTFPPTDEAALLAEIERAGFAETRAMYDAYRERLSATGVPTGLTEVRAAFLTDQIYREPATRMAQTQVAAGGRAWSALFSDAPLGPAVGACHGADVLYLFDLIAMMGVADPQRLAVRDELHAAWRSFAATGDPGWPTHQPGATRQFGGEAKFVIEPPDDRVAELRRTPTTAT